MSRPHTLFRKVGDEEGGRPTILYDEVDTLFGSKVQDTRRNPRSLERRATVAEQSPVAAWWWARRCERRKFQRTVRSHSPGIGNLPDTIASRSILIEMRRRAIDERCGAVQASSAFVRGEEYLR